MFFYKTQYPKQSRLLANDILTPTTKHLLKNRPLPGKALAGFSLFKPGNAANPGMNRAFAAKIDIIRLAAIASIVWGHTLFGWDNVIFITKTNTVIQVLIMQLGRVGTINFFIISGFLFSDKVKNFTVRSYLKYRLRSLIIPWFIFIGICVVLQVFQLYTLPQITRLGSGAIISLLFNLGKAAIFHAAFWFIPVSLVSAIFLIVTKRYINNAWFGLLLFAITLLYGVNLYYGWFAENHARSFLGYVFYMWLGIQLKYNLGYVKHLVDSISWRLLAIILTAALLLACFEGWHLKAIGCPDAFGSTRLSNAFLSVVVFIMLIKMRTIYSVKKLNPKKYVYAVYLIHSIILVEVMPVMQKFVISHNLFAKMPLIIVTQICAYACVMALSYFIAVAIKKSKLHFLVGK